METFRGRIFNQGIIRAPAADVWAALTNWGSVDKLRRPNASQGPLALSKLELVGSPDKTPRTRVMHFGAMGIIKETLLYQDDEFMHLYYNMEGAGPLGIRNYLATTDVDQLAPSISQITITARFDVPSGVDIVQAKTIINAAHVNAVILGLKFNLETTNIQP